MEIEIQSKTDNLFLARTEVHFIIHHEGEGTPKRDLIRNELAEKLNAKKEAVMIDHMHSHFGARKTIGYAKIYKTVEDAKKIEGDPILKRNGLATRKKAKKKEAKKEGGEKPAAKEKPAKQEKKEEPVPKEEKPAEKPKEEVKHAEKPKKE